VCAAIKYAKDGTSLQQKDGKGMRVENIHGTDDHPYSTSARKKTEQKHGVKRVHTSSQTSSGSGNIGK